MAKAKVAVMGTQQRPRYAATATAAPMVTLQPRLRLPAMGTQLRLRLPPMATKPRPGHITKGKAAPIGMLLRVRQPPISTLPRPGHATKGKAVPHEHAAKARAHS